LNLNQYYSVNYMDPLFLLIPLSFFMGVVNSVAGGGGVFGVPALLAMGMPPVNALALNRISDIGNIVGSLKNYMKVKDFDQKLGFIAIPLILVGAFLGAHFVVGLEEDLLNKVVIGAVIIGIVFLIYPFKTDASSAKPMIAYGMIALLFLGFWDGAFAMAGGTFGVLIFVLLFKKSYLGAKSVMTFAAIPETLMTAAILTYNANIEWTHGLAMFISAILGAYIGSKIAIKKGSHFIRYAMAAMAFVIVLKIVIFDIL